MTSVPLISFAATAAHQQYTDIDMTNDSTRTRHVLKTAARPHLSVTLPSSIPKVTH
jgi:hypothetical protein